MVECRKLLAVIGLLLGLLIPTLARADAPPVWQGVWKGTIGALPVRVCLTKRDYGGPRGYYYYLSQLKIISLEQQGDSKVWIEGSSPIAGKPAWTFETVSGDLLAGTWRDADKALPFRLDRLVAPRGDGLTESDGLCGGMAFNGPRIPPVRITSKPAVKDGVHYTRQFYDPGKQFDIHVESFALPGTTAGERGVNALLRKLLPSSNGTNDYIDCELAGLDSSGGGGNYSLSVVPVMITRNWLATEASEDSYCGGAHPNAGIYPAVYDLAKGVEVDPRDWFGVRAVTRAALSGGMIAKTLTPAFRAFVLTHQSPPDPKCREALTTADFWDLGLSRKGMTFSPSLAHVDQGCSDAIIVPFGQLARFLNAKGVAAVGSVVADLKAR